MYQATIMSLISHLGHALSHPFRHAHFGDGQLAPEEVSGLFWIPELRRDSKRVFRPSEMFLERWPESWMDGGLVSGVQQGAWDSGLTTHGRP